LTAFCFHPEKSIRGLFWRRKTLRESPYVYIPCSEEREWKLELEMKMLKQGKITREEIEGDRPDWHGRFFEWSEVKKKRKEN